jgi:hypothetical protein
MGAASKRIIVLTSWAVICRTAGNIQDETRNSRSLIMQVAGCSR